jgi:hypothetical protein
MVLNPARLSSLSYFLSGVLSLPYFLDWKNGLGLDFDVTDLVVFGVWILGEGKFLSNWGTRLLIKNIILASAVFMLTGLTRSLYLSLENGVYRTYIVETSNCSRIFLEGISTLLFVLVFE